MKRSLKKIISKAFSPLVAYSFLGFIGIATLLVGIISLQRTITNPASRVLVQRQEVVDRISAQIYEEDKRLRTQDTDRDGLTDYQELTVYGTSPYLVDSDSDGFADSEEIQSGNDPNCPSGNDCRSVPAGAVGDPVDSNGGITTNQFSDLLIQLPEEEPVETIDLTTLTPDEVRQLLVDSGEITADQLSAIDDETLMTIYEEVINEVDDSL